MCPVCVHLHEGQEGQNANINQAIRSLAIDDPRTGNQQWKTFNERREGLEEYRSAKNGWAHLHEQMRRQRKRRVPTEARTN